MKGLYVETYGCQMNVSDSEIVCAILGKHGYRNVARAEEADVIFINTCSIREKAEVTARNRIRRYKAMKGNNHGVVVGVLGCMAERLKKKFLEEEQIVDLVAGPDAYRDLPRLLEEVHDGRKAVNTFLSREETYADISPVRYLRNGVTAFISIMRGCDNMCSFCVVPFTRGRERSRDPHSILREASALFARGYREVTLLGQNVDSYRWSPPAGPNGDAQTTVRFSNLLSMVAAIDPLLRVRFSTSHPKDITQDVLHTMKAHNNLCKHIHFPVQSGSSRVLTRMHRGYSREDYLHKVTEIRRILGEDCGLSSDIIAGFCAETESDHQETITLMRTVAYDYSYMFAYSRRPGTLAARRYEDNVSAAVKKRRLQEIIATQRSLSIGRNRLDVGKWHRVLVEGQSKRSDAFYQGRNTANKVVVFPRGDARIGDYADVFVRDCTAATLIGEKSA